jgi:hypothetical protein
MKLGIVSMVAAIIIAFGSPAEAKGPSALMITGAGVDRPIVVGDDSPTWPRIVNSSAFFDTAFSTLTFGSPAFAEAGPSPLPNHLGPRLRLTWTVHWDSAHHLVQDLYPDALGGPLLYTPAGQALYDHPTAGGWYRASTRFVDTLEAVGVPSPGERRKASTAVSTYVRPTMSGVIARW